MAFLNTLNKFLFFFDFEWKNEQNPKTTGTGLLLYIVSEVGH